jgi:hypothetical protein
VLNIYSTDLPEEGGCTDVCQQLESGTDVFNFAAPTEQPGSTVEPVPSQRSGCSTLLGLKAKTNQNQTSATTSRVHFARRRQEHPSKPILKAFHCELDMLNSYVAPGVMKNQLLAQFGLLE